MGITANNVGFGLGEQDAAAKYIQDRPNAARIILFGHTIGAGYDHSAISGRESRT